jgi:hypothetical protein
MTKINKCKRHYFVGARRGAGGVSVAEAQLLRISVIEFVRLKNKKKQFRLIRNSFHANDQIFTGCRT